MRIARRQLRRIIKEEYRKILLEGPGVDAISPTARNSRELGRRDTADPIRGEDDSNWVIWAEQYGFDPNYDNEGQLHFYVEADWPEAEGVLDEAESMGASIENSLDGYNWIIYTGEYR